MHSVFQKVEEARNSCTPAALCIVTGTTGSTPRKAGSKMIVYADGSIYGTIGGGGIEKEIIAQAVKVISDGNAIHMDFQLEKDLGMHCGGKMGVFIEPVCTSRKLFIFGAGHIGKALAKFAFDLDFSVHVIDPRPEMFDESFKNCGQIVQDFVPAASSIESDASSFIVIVTPKHVFDEDVVAAVARKPHAYLGMIGSSRKVALLRKRFLEENILTEAELDAVDMPIGLKIGAETPAEIAISILSKMIAVRNQFELNP